MPNSNTRSIQVGSVDNTLIATAYNTDGSIKADLAFDTTGISIFVQRIGEANGSALTLSAKASASTAHADGAFLNLGGGDISVDCPDAPFATYKGRARIYGTFTGGTIIGEWFDVVGFDAAAVAVGANTVEPTNALSTADAAGIRHRLGLDGTATAPTAAGAKLGDLQLTQMKIDASAVPLKRAIEVKTDDASSFIFEDIEHNGIFAWSAEDSLLSIGSIDADLRGKVLGEGSETIAGVGVQADVSTGSTNAIRSGLATGTNVTDARDSILNRIGAFAGTGLNTIKGFLLAIMSKTATKPSDVSGDYDPATDSQEANADTAAAIKLQTDKIPNNPAAVSDVQVTVEPDITVNPTELSSGSIDAIRNGLATLNKQDAILEAIDEIEGGGGPGLGDGMFRITLTIKRADGALLPDCEVVLTSTPNSPSLNSVAGGRTIFNGTISFDLDEGVYYIWRQKTGITFSDNPRILTVAPDGTYSVT